MGYDYEIIYKGKENAVDDNLSNQFEEDGSLFSLSLLVSGWLEEYHQEWLKNSAIVILIGGIKGGPLRYTWWQDTFSIKGPFL